MRLHTAITAGALALAPALALAAQPWFVRIDGHSVPMQHSTRLLRTAAGTARISIWSWQGPQGSARIVVERGPGSAPPAWALRQMRFANAQLRAVQRQFGVLDRVLSRAAWPPAGTLGASWLPPFAQLAPQPVQLLVPQPMHLLVPQPVLLLVPAPQLQHAAPAAHAPAAHAPAARHRVPGLPV